MNIDMTRREFSRFCAMGATPVGGTIIGGLCSSALAATNVSADGTPRTVKFRDGTIVPALGQGSAGLAEEKRPAATEEEALRTGLSLGMTLIDTAEIYGNGRSEELIGRAIAGQRDRVFLVSKVHPDHVVGDGVARACEASLARLNTNYLDLYLLHWRNSDTNLAGVVKDFESLRAAGKIRAWGVSNFKVKDMEDVFRVPHGDRCATNQVLYNLGERAIERDLLPWCKRHRIPVSSDAFFGPCGFFHSASPWSSNSSTGLLSAIMRWYFSISPLASCAYARGAPSRAEAARTAAANRVTQAVRRSR